MKKKMEKNHNPKEISGHMNNIALNPKNLELFKTSILH